MPEEEYLTPGEVAKILRLAEESVTRLLRQKKLPGGIKVAGSWRINRRKFQAFLDDMEQEQQRKD